MHALVKARAATGIDLQDIAKPVPGPNDVLIRVKRAAICGTDMRVIIAYFGSLQTLHGAPIGK